MWQQTSMAVLLVHKPLCIGGPGWLGLGGQGQMRKGWGRDEEGGCQAGAEGRKRWGGDVGQDSNEA